MTDNFENRGDEERAMLEAAATAAATPAGEQSFEEFTQSPDVSPDGLGVVADEAALSTAGMTLMARGREWVSNHRGLTAAGLATFGTSAILGVGISGAAAYANNSERTSANAAPFVPLGTETTPTDPTSSPTDPTSSPTDPTSSPTDPSSSPSSSPTVEMPIAKADKLSFIPWHRYNATKELLSNDVINDGGSLVGDKLTITGVTPITQKSVQSEVSYDPKTDQVYITPQGTEEGQRLDFSYTESRSSDDAATTGTVSFLVDKTKPIRTKHFPSGKVEWINDNPARSYVQDRLLNGHLGIKPFSIKAEGHTRKMWPPKARTEWFSELTKYKIIFTNHLLRARHKG